MNKNCANEESNTQRIECRIQFSFHGAIEYSNCPNIMFFSPHLPVNRTRLFAMSKINSICAPGSSGSKNLTDGIFCILQWWPRSFLNALIISSNITTPGTIGWPGKCPLREGWLRSI